MALKVEQPDDRVKSIRVQIGDEWSARDFGKPIDRKIAAAHAMTMVAALGGSDLAGGSDAE